MTLLVKVTWLLEDIILTIYFIQHQLFKFSELIALITIYIVNTEVILLCSDILADCQKMADKTYAAGIQLTTGFNKKISYNFVEVCVKFIISLKMMTVFF